MKSTYPQHQKGGLSGLCEVDGWSFTLVAEGKAALAEVEKLAGTTAADGVK